MTSNHDLRSFQDSDAVAAAFSKLVSGGKSGYRTIIEKSKPTIKCNSCKKMLEGTEKFCPECGTKTEFGKS